MTESKLSERFAALISFLSDKVPADELEDSADVAGKILASIVSYESHPDAVAKAVEAEREIIWTLELEAGRVKLCEFWVKIADDLHEGDARYPELGRKAIETEQALTLMGEIICARATSPSPPFDEAAERAAFEEWKGPQYLAGEYLRTTTGNYCNQKNEDEWSAWLASAQRRRV